MITLVFCRSRRLILLFLHHDRVPLAQANIDVDESEGKIQQCTLGVCISEVNEKIAHEGLELDDRLVMNFSDNSASGGVEAPIIQLRWSDHKRKKAAPPMFCSYCPFCGRKK